MCKHFPIAGCMVHFYSITQIDFHIQSGYLIFKLGFHSTGDEANMLNHNIFMDLPNIYVFLKPIIKK